MIRSRYLRRLTVLKPGSSFTPTQISGLALWLDASDASSLTLDGSDNVSQWNDKSGNARHLTQSNTTSRPSYKPASQINGITVPLFDGTDDRMTASFTSIAQPTTSFVVIRVSRVAGFQAFYDSFASLPHDVYLNNASAVLESGSALSISGGTVSVNTAAMLCGQHNGASSVLRLNRSQVATGNSGTQSLTNGITIGTNRNANAFVQGNIAEFVFYSRLLTAGEIDSVEAYLKAKWGTP